jgi:hypothetical protein
MFGVKVGGHQDRQNATKTSVQVGSEQWAGGRKLSGKDFCRFAGQHNLYGLLMGQAWNVY